MPKTFTSLEPGQRFGRLTVVRKTKPLYKGEPAYLCRCDCGATLSVAGKSLRHALTKSCGCLRKDVVRKLMTTHGMTYTKTWHSWSSMIQRCSDRSRDSFKYYGGRGIRICDRWLVFENFLADMGKRPQGKTLDRIDTNGNYEPANCRWATPYQQVHNRRNYIRKSA